MANVLNLSLGSRCVKYLMFVFNLFFVITGIILLSIGIVVYGLYYNYHHFLDDKFLSIPSLLIAIGAIIFFIAFFGCCGAIRENYCMIITFALLLVGVFVLELSGGISGYVLRARASTIIQEKMKDSMHVYNNTDIAFVWDKLQYDFDCCGTNNASDWVTISGTQVLPKSCCGVEADAAKITNCTLSSGTILHQGGCYNKFLSFVKTHALQLGGFGIGIAFVQAIGLWFAVFLARSIRNSYESV